MNKFFYTGVILTSLTLSGCSSSTTNDNFNSTDSVLQSTKMSSSEIKEKKLTP